MQQPRDPDIRFIRARNDFRCYGMGLGIILLDDVYPGFPGDVRNASAYPFPIQYEIAEGVDIPLLVTAEDKSPCLPPVVRAAQKLAAHGLPRHRRRVWLFCVFPARTGRQRGCARLQFGPAASAACPAVGRTEPRGRHPGRAEAVSHRSPPGIGGYHAGQ